MSEMNRSSLETVLVDINSTISLMLLWPCFWQWYLSFQMLDDSNVRIVWNNEDGCSFYFILARQNQCSWDQTR